LFVLCDYSLTQEEVLDKLLDYALGESEEHELATDRKRPSSMALEILSAENPNLCNGLVQSSRCLECIWNVLETSTRLDSIRANALLRIISSLLSRNPKEVCKIPEC
jgi:hypothetical protein